MQRANTKQKSSHNSLGPKTKLKKNHFSANPLAIQIRIFSHRELKTFNGLPNAENLRVVSVIRFQNFFSQNGETI